MLRKEGQGAFTVVMIISIATIWVFSILVSSTQVNARLPPKLVKTVNNVGKALYAGRYGYSVVPIPAHITLQTNVARKEVHIPLRLRKKRRPMPRRPQYASKFVDYTPAPSMKHTRMRRPQKPRPHKPRIPYRDPDYYENDDEVVDESDYDYEERPKRHRDHKDYDGFIAQHSELYTSGYNPGRKKKGKYRDDEVNYSDQTDAMYARKPKPNIKSWTGVIRPSNKLYSAAIGVHPRPIVPREEERYHHSEEDEEEEEEEEITRPKYTREKKNKLRYRDAERYEDGRRHHERERYHQQEYYNPDNIYHDRAYEAKQKRRERGVENRDEEHIERAKLDESTKSKNNKGREEPWSVEEPSDWKGGGSGNHWKTNESDYKERIEETDVVEKQQIGEQAPWRSSPGPDLEKPKATLKSILQRDQWTKEVDEYNNGWKPKETAYESRNVESWTQSPLQTVHTITWIEPSSAESIPSMPPPLSSPKPSSRPIFPPFTAPSVPAPSPSQLHTLAIFEKPKGLIRQEVWPDVKQSFRWNGQTATNIPSNNATKTQRVKSKKKKNNRNIETPRLREEFSGRNQYKEPLHGDIVAQRTVGDTMKWNSNNQDNRDTTHNWNIQGFRQNIKSIENKGHQHQHQQWNVETMMSDSLSDKFKTDGDIIYGSKIGGGNQNKWRKDSDIGFGQGMEVFVDDKVAGWQVY